MIWLNIGLSSKITKIRTNPVFCFTTETRIAFSETGYSVYCVGDIEKWAIMSKMHVVRVRLKSGLGYVRFSFVR